MSSQPFNPRPSYQKPWLSHADQVAQLVSRGLTVADSAAAEQFLSHVNYYRFSGYCVAFESQRHQFYGGCTFAQVGAAYEFDMTLRDLVTEALEVVEVDFRAAIAYHFGHQCGAFGHVDSANFFHRFRHTDWLDQLRDEAVRSSEEFIDHFRRNYAEYPNLPIWMAMEIMSFGALSKMYKGMVRRDQGPIARRDGVQPVDLIAIFHHLVSIRNLCAHHSRLWNRVWAIKPSLPKGQAWRPPQLPSNDRLFGTLLLLYHLMKRCPAVGPIAITWRDRIKQHLMNPPSMPDSLAHMGMSQHWDQHPIWN